MQDFGFYIKRDRTELPPQGERNVPHNTVITDLPEREEPLKPRDLPSPKHRPGEPILYDPPVGNSRDVYLPMGDSPADPFTGRSMIDPMR